MKNLSTTTRILLSVGLVCLIVLLGLHFYARYEFASAYEQYALAAKRHSDAAYIPGVAENDIRKDLNQVLARVLSQEMTDSERHSLARRGQALLEASEVQIDTIGDIGTEVVGGIQKMQESAEIPGAFTSSDEIRDIIQLAEDRFDIIGDIRGLSYRAQFTTGQIFKQIIDDGGALRPQYVSSLNQELPAIEEQYNQRTNFYSKLESVSKDIESRFADFDNSF